ncbi:MAG: hypothetical protein KC619_23155 [Myxococcales bacterium]|nr:hypothetical protein [Myxococcales bacterium]
MRWRIAILVLWSLGCDAPAAAPRYAPLVCDDAAADHVAFGVQMADAHFAPTGQRHYGEHFLFVDGSCRWFAGRTDVDPLALVGAVRTGTLDASLLAELNASLLTGPWERLDADYRAWGGPDGGADAPTHSLWRDERGVRCYSGCADWADYRPMQNAALDWERRLAELGVPFEGPVRLVWSHTSSTLARAHDWTGATDLASALTESYGELLVTDEGDAATLRAWRAEAVRGEAIAMRVAERHFTAYVIDAIPIADDAGRVRPPF